MKIILFTMRDVEQQYVSATLNNHANFAEIGVGRRRTRGGAGGAVAAENVAIKPSKFRTEAAAVANPFAAPVKQSVTQQVKQAARDAPTYMRRTKRGALAIVKKGQRKTGRAIAKVTSPGVRAGAGNIATGARQIAGDVAVASKRAGRGVLSHVGANRGKYALAAAGLTAAGAGAAYLMNRNKQQQYSRRPTSIYFSRR